MSADEPNLGEFELIRRFFQGRDAVRPAGSGVVLGIGDDAAVLALPPETELIATVDTLVAGRHFPQGTDARSIGHRALAVNLSDLAAMGATPAWATLALTLPSADAAWLERFSAGLLDLADAHGVALVGGDTTRGPLTVSVQLLGHVPRGTALRRGGARAGDLLAVTGTLGDAGAGLAFVTTPPSAESRLAVERLIER
jgi:thiamine-monophosphate kinase